MTTMTMCGTESETQETTPILSDVQGLTLAVQQNPEEATSRLALRDTIQEAGASLQAATRRVAKIVRNAEDRKRSPKSVKRWLKGSLSLDVIRAELALANGSRRERTLSLEDVIDTIAKIRMGKLAWKAIGGGTVANAYRYRAWQTACLIAVRSNGSLRIVFGSISANGSPSMTNWASGLTARATDEQFRQWADLDSVPTL